MLTLLAGLILEKMVQTGKLMHQVMSSHEFFCSECKGKEIFKGEDLRHCTFKAHAKGWSSTLTLCPECSRKYKFVQVEINH